MRLRSIEEYLFVHATEIPDKVAVVAGNQETDYRTLYEKAYEYHEYLKMSGVSKGDIVVTRASQDLKFVVIYLAIHMAGGIVTSLERNIPLVGFEQAAGRICAKFVLLNKGETLEGPWKNLYYRDSPLDERYPVLPAIDFPDPEETADILFTTGTTGTSKGVELSHKALVATAEKLIYGCGYKSDTFLLVPGPLNHANAIRKLFATIVNASTICLLNGMSDIPGFFRALDYPLGIKACCLPPAAIRTLFALTDDRIGAYSDKIDFIESASAPLPESDKERLCQLLPKTRLYNHYASSESAAISMYDYNEFPGKRGCVGREMPGTHVIVVGDDYKEIKSDKDHMGLLACISDTNMKGYVRNRELTEKVPGDGVADMVTDEAVDDVTDRVADGVVYTRDIGYKDEDGYIYLSGRKGDAINVGGVKVSPTDVEEAALAFDGVDDSVCIAMDDSITGQALKLLVVLHPGVTLNVPRIREFLAARIEAVKVPRHYEQVEKIERTHNGKIDRKFYSEKS